MLHCSSWKNILLGKRSKQEALKYPDTLVTIAVVEYPDSMRVIEGHNSSCTNISFGLKRGTAPSQN